MKKKIIFNIAGMTCASCARSNEKALAKTKGVTFANVNFASRKASVEYDSDILGEKQIEKTIVDNGYGVSHEHSEHSHKNESAGENWRDFLSSLILSLPLVLEMVYKFRSGVEILNVDLVMYAHAALAAIVVFHFGSRFHVRAWKQLQHFQANMDTLVSMGTLVAYFFSLWILIQNILYNFENEGYFEVAAIIITLILLGKYFEAKSIGLSGEAMRKLLELGAKKARVLRGEQEKEVDVSEIKVGDIILVKPSEKIPLDGEVVEGQSEVNESMLTGESMPAFKKIGSLVFGATINEDGVLKIKITQTGEGTVLSQIIKTVEEAQNSKAPIQKLADKISGIFVPVVIAIALLTFLIWYALAKDVSGAVISAVAVLVIACPCALGLATPTAIMAGTGKGAKRGILFKSGEGFEAAKEISSVVFDKTGTLTQGAPKVKKIIFNPEFGFPEEKILKIAASIAKNSEHPLSKSVAEYAKGENIILADFSNFKEIRGKGAAAICVEHGIEVLLGNKKLLEDFSVSAIWAEKILNDDEAGTKLFVTHDKKVIGSIVVADEIRAEAKGIVEKLKTMKLRVVMISGDNKKTAEAVGKELGIEKIIAEVLPGEKAEEIKKMQKGGEKIVFVGDGINDAPSLVQADLGIAMGSATDIAKEAGQIILMQNNLEKVVEAIKLSKMTFQTIRQNLFWAFFYNAIAIPLAFLGLLSPAIAAGAMAFSSVSVVLNSLRIYKRK